MEGEGDAQLLPHDKGVGNHVRILVIRWFYKMKLSRQPLLCALLPGLPVSTTTSTTLSRVCPPAVSTTASTTLSRVHHLLSSLHHIERFNQL